MTAVLTEFPHNAHMNSYSNDFIKYSVNSNKYKRDST